jgi:hypothetical protein
LEQQQAKTAKPAEDPASAELVKLRGEVARLRPIEKQFQQLQAESQQMRANMQELQKANAEATTIRNQNLQLQGVLQAKAATETCMMNLRQLFNAKAQWALENKKTAMDVPTDVDLFPKYVAQKPVCPSGGIYTLGPVQAKPTCNTPGHNF